MSTYFICAGFSLFVYICIAIGNSFRFLYFWFYLCIQGIPEQPETGKIARLIAVFPQLFCFQK
jgi:hypothetical protein